jgi:hypothetical protein
VSERKRRKEEIREKKLRGVVMVWSVEMLGGMKDDELKDQLMLWQRKLPAQKITTSMKKIQKQAKLALLIQENVEN